MPPFVAYVLMAVSATFYCTFDTIIKEQQFKHNNQTNAVFKAECEVEECLGRTLKLYENGKLIEDGFLTVAAVFHDFNNTLIEEGKKEFNACLLEVNQQLSSIPRCSKLQTGIKLLEFCMDKKMKKFHKLH